MKQEFVFKKVNGEIRTMLTTTDFEWVKQNQPEAWEAQKPKGIRIPSKKVLTVWDVENKGWRAIKPETIIGKRVVSDRKRPAPFKLTDKDFYHKKYGHKPFSNIRKGQTPYYVLMMLNICQLNEAQISDTVFDIMLSKGWRMEKRAGKVRSVQRVLSSYVRQGVLFKNENGKFSLTNKGSLMLTLNVE